eukprot:TRINITY_DN27153_c0_g1_i1.p1 TRINITY_DN27153_c0_g1~~TRINITY_DN27153_c0_g1_i1.p1  ORF type:complete len:300 (-),score=47.94 TRINITY_DN27153_c0_g1_i1:312-1211(-)
MALVSYSDDCFVPKSAYLSVVAQRDSLQQRVDKLELELARERQHNATMCRSKRQSDEEQEADTEIDRGSKRRRDSLASPSTTASTEVPSPVSSSTAASSTDLLDNDRALHLSLLTLMKNFTPFDYSKVRYQLVLRVVPEGYDWARPALSYDFYPSQQGNSMWAVAGGVLTLCFFQWNTKGPAARSDEIGTSLAVNLDDLTRAAKRICFLQNAGLGDRNGDVIKAIGLTKIFDDSEKGSRNDVLRCQEAFELHSTSKHCLTIELTLPVARQLGQGVLEPLLATLPRDMQWLPPKKFVGFR